jgi:hypothetical protein
MCFTNNYYINEIKKDGREHVVRMQSMRFAYRNFIGKSERDRPLGRPRH